MNSLVYPEILMYSRNFCSDCVRSKAFLDNNKIPYKEINILEDKKAQEKVINPLRLLDMLTLLIKIVRVILFLQLLGQKVLKTTEKTLCYFINMIIIYIER